MEEYTNYLAHYGVKGMKWKNHKYATLNGLEKIQERMYDEAVTRRDYYNDAGEYTGTEYRRIKNPAERRYVQKTNGMGKTEAAARYTLNKFKENNNKSNLKARPNPSYYKNKATSTIKKVGSRTLKTSKEVASNGKAVLDRAKSRVYKAATKERTVNVGKHSFRTGTFNGQDVKGKKHKYFIVSHRKNGKVKNNRVYKIR